MHILLERPLPAADFQSKSATHSSTWLCRGLLCGDMIMYNIISCISRLLRNKDRAAIGPGQGMDQVATDKAQQKLPARVSRLFLNSWAKSIAAYCLRHAHNDIWSHYMLSMPLLATSRVLGPNVLRSYAMKAARVRVNAVVATNARRNHWCNNNTPARRVVVGTISRTYTREKGKSRTNRTVDLLSCERNPGGKPHLCLVQVGL